MPTIGAPLRKWTTFLLLCSIPTLAFAHSANETAHVEPGAPTASASPSSTSTEHASAAAATLPLKSSSLLPYSDSECPFRTINYITHTLPQQCLKTSWSASDDTGGAEGTVALPEETGAAADTTGTQSEAELETDSPLDNANFLSFEDWKKKNLARAGQSPENVGQGRAASSESRAQRRPVNINALDSLGDESEIEIDFSGFGSPAEGDEGSSALSTDSSEVAEATGAAADDDDDDKVAPSSWAISKDAGKTCKERFNYASFDCAATVLKTNPKAKSTSSVLIENKDSYMLNECSAPNKFVIVELCDDILVDTVVLANYEFFSSMFRHFRVSVSDRYPVKMERWRALGTFEARNSREIQPFLVGEPQIWARYLRIEFLTHYGNEFYCPLSLLRVHGTTMMEQFRREEEQARGDDDFVMPIEAAEGDPVKTAAPLPNEGGSTPPTEQQPTEPDKVQAPVSEVPSTADSTLEAAEAVGTPSQSPIVESQQESAPSAPAGPIEPVAADNATEARKEADAASQAPMGASSSTSLSFLPSSDGSRVTDTADAEKRSLLSTSATISAAAPPKQNSSEEESSASPPDSSGPSGKTAKSIANDVPSVTSASSSVKVAPNVTANGSPAQAQSRSSQTQPNPASPTTQESFFKSIHKRLQQLEANSTLSLQYIEEQSRILRDAFIKVEKRQLSKTEKFLDHLNSTVMQELKSYRSMYDQLWQSTILELEGMKERQRAEIGEIGARLSMVADELVWQKRMAVVQSTLLLLCLGLVLFVRSGPMSAQSDLPIVQQLGHRYSSFFDSPPRSPQLTGSFRNRRTFRNMWRSHSSAGLSERSGHLSDGMNASDAETDGRRSPAQVAFAPPTPITPRGASRLSREMDSSPIEATGTPFTAVDRENGLLTPTDGTGLDDHTKRVQVLETQSGPATPRGSRDCRPSWEEVDRAVDLLKAEEQGQAQELEQHGGRETEMQTGHRKKRSPLRRTESYDGVDDDDDDDDDSPGGN